MVSAEQLIQGTVPVSELSRLHDLLADDSGELRAELRFSQDDERRSRIDGELNATVRVFCQRCLQAMSLEVSQTLTLAVVFSEKAVEQLPRWLDSVLLDGETLDIKSLLEDEFLLALPIVSSHSEACGEREYLSIEPEVEPEERQKPFEHLADLLGKK